MRRVHLLRVALLEIGSPVVGLFLAVYLPLTKTLEPWELPLIGGLLFGNLVSREDLGVVGATLTKLSKKDPPE